MQGMSASILLEPRALHEHRAWSQLPKHNTCKREGTWKECDHHIGGVLSDCISWGALATKGTVCVCVCVHTGRCAIYDQRQHTLSLPRSAPTCGTDVVFSTHGVPGEGC